MDILVYSSRGCGFCSRQKAFFEENGITFEERDISNKEFYQEFKELGGLGTPFTIIKESGGIVEKLNGFNKGKLSELLISE